MQLTPGIISGRKSMLQYSSLTIMEKKCYEGEVQSNPRGRRIVYKLLILTFKALIDLTVLVETI